MYEAYVTAGSDAHGFMELIAALAWAKIETEKMQLFENYTYLLET